MNNYEIDITAFFTNESPRDFSASVAEIGKNAGADTWQAAKEATTEHDFLDNPEKVDNFKRYIAGFAVWSTEEVDDWSHQKLTALFIQMVSGDIRDAGLDQRPVDWVAYQEQVEAGNCSGNIYGGSLLAVDDGKIYFSISQ